MAKAFNMLDAIQNYQNDFALFAKDCIKVRDHNTSKILPLIFRPGQAVMHDIAIKRRKEVDHLKILLLKNRRFGGSTYIGGRGYHKASLNFNQNVFIIAHEDKSTTTLYRMVQLMQEKNPIKPSTRTSNAIELRFDTKSGDGLKSEYALSTAKNVEAGRSQGIHFLHCSEESAWPGHAAELLDSLMNCFPKPPTGSEVWRESTGKGFGNSFQLDVFEAYAEGKYPYFRATVADYAPHMPDAGYEFTFAYHNPDVSDWVLMFVPWFLDPANQKEFESEDRLLSFKKRLKTAETNPDNINYDALKLQSKYKLSFKQLYWRESEIKNSSTKEVAFFNQENPTTVLDGFRKKGASFYGAELCDIAESGCLSPVVTGNVFRRMGIPVIEPNPLGKFQVWDRYESKEQYFLTVDTAGGKREKHSKENREPDKTVIDVWNHRNGRQAAQWCGHIDYDLIGDIVEAIGEMYGTATACVELNNQGHAVVAQLKRSEYPMYSYAPGEYGWLTSRGVKPTMVTDSLSGIRDGLITIRCKETVSEMRTYAEMSGKYGAEAGCKDDRVTSFQIAIQMMTKLDMKIEGQDEAVDDHNYDHCDAGWMAA